MTTNKSISVMVALVLLLSNILNFNSYAATPVRITAVKESTIKSFFGAYKINESKTMIVLVNDKGATIVNRSIGTTTTDEKTAKIDSTGMSLVNGVLKFKNGSIKSITKKSNGIYAISTKSIGDLTAFKSTNLDTLMKDKRVKDIVAKENLEIPSKKDLEVKVENTDKKVETIEVVDPEIQKIAEELKTKIVIEDDLMIFTLFAFMNYTGYDDENSKSGFHPVRKAVRDDLKKMDIGLIDNNYYKNKAMPYHYYVQVLRLMDSNFELRSSIPNYLSKLSDLNINLKEFYIKADIPKLYEKYQTDYQKEFNKYGDGTFVNLAKLIKFLKVDIKNVNPFHVNVNLMDAYYRGSGLGSTYAHLSNSGMIVSGPSEEANYQNIVHEFLHGVITPINNQNRDQIERITYLKSTIPFETKQLSSYQSLFAIYDESVIRSLTSITAARI